ncbi:Emopamil binding protein-domain-containing protein [Catenaria anguillulae PL171]|uniref:Emopamil binding protein-domain-containing protein n=1 Tax=Catenaria anguillulae PL171 TaxID=765915 RepID=A0A1Y2HSW8_9FUNG|nr:Emopamil binding protein-domain-containing protein [Catenaria anguillulae PL171]
MAAADSSPVVPRKLSEPVHPFYPRTLHLPNYSPNATPGHLIFGGFGLVCALVALFSFLVLGRNLPLFRRLIFVWCIVSGSIHMVLEGYFVVFWKDLAGLQTVLGMIWKEYAKCDSRYMWGERAVWTIEGITAFAWGPLLYLVAYRIYTAHTKVHSYMPWLLMLSTGQLYGTILYFATSLRLTPASSSTAHAYTFPSLEYFQDILARTVYDDGIPHPYYFWVYFFLMNFIWVVVPSVCMVWCMRELTKDPLVKAARKSK